MYYIQDNADVALSGVSRLPYYLTLKTKKNAGASLDHMVVTINTVPPQKCAQGVT